MSITSRLKFDEGTCIDTYSYVAGQETALVKLLAAYMEWKVLDLEYENKGNLRILDNVTHTVDTARQKLRDEYPEYFKESDDSNS